jgi:hypothetical protein
MNIRIPWIWVTVGLFLLIELLLLWAFDRQDDRHRATLLFGATIVAGAFALYSYLHRIQEQRFKEAGKMMMRWNAPERVANRMIMANVTDGLFDISTIRRLHAAHKFDKDIHEIRIQVLSALNFYEELAIGIFEKSIDNDRSCRFFFTLSPTKPTRCFRNGYKTRETLTTPKTTILSLKNSSVNGETRPLAAHSVVHKLKTPQTQ